MQPIEDLPLHSVDVSEKIHGLGSYDLLYLCLSPGEFSEEAYRRTFIKGYRNIINASQYKKIIMVSSTSVYSQSNGELVTEEDAAPTTFSGKVLLEAEKLIQESSKEYCVLRLSGIYGPSRTSILRSVREKKAVYDRDDSSFTNRIHIDDIVGFSCHVLEKNISGVFNVSDSLPVAKNQFLKHLAQLCDVELAEGKATKPSLRRTNKKVSNQKMIDSNYKLKYPSYVEAYRDLIKT